MLQEVQVTGIERGRTIYHVYDAAVLGLLGYWYPAMLSARLRRAPVRVTLCGEDIAFFRQQGRVFALADRCAHRGVPLSLGRVDFPGTITCRYHGWVYEVATGRLAAALTDGPDSPICRNPFVAVRPFPCREQGGMIWVYVGEGEPPPLEEQVPADFFADDCISGARITEQVGDWRHAVENGFDEGHPKYLHRDQLWKLFRFAAAWSQVEVAHEGRWLVRAVRRRGFRSEYPGLGVWPRRPPFWRRPEGAQVKKSSRPSRISVSLPGCVRVEESHGWHDFEWFVPVVPGRYRFIQVIRKKGPPLTRALFWLQYWIHLRWVFHVDFFNADSLMVRHMRTPPEHLYRPDVSIVEWRRQCERECAGRAITRPHQLSLPRGDTAFEVEAPR